MIFNWFIEISNFSLNDFFTSFVKKINFWLYIICMILIIFSIISIVSDFFLWIKNWLKSYTKQTKCEIHSWSLKFLLIIMKLNVILWKNLTENSDSNEDVDTKWCIFVKTYVSHSLTFEAFLIFASLIFTPSAAVSRCWVTSFPACASSWCQ